MNGFTCSTKVITGAGALEALSTLHAQRVLVVTDRFFAENGTAAAIAARIPGAVCEIFGEVLPDPDTALVARGAAALSRFSPDLILAVGGGSPIDCAKAIRFCADTHIPLVAVPTTSGTGSEVTSFSVLTHGAVKLPIVDDALAPELAILDETLLATLPPDLVAEAGFDLLSHCVEAVCATDANLMSRALAVGAFSAVFSMLPRSFSGETCVRGAIHEASCAAGVAFNNAGLGVCHALSHALGGAFHVSHGRLNAVLLPHVIAFNAPAGASALGALATAAGLGGSTDTLRVRNLISGLRRLRAQLALPQTLTQTGIMPAALEQALPELCDAALTDRCLPTNPVPVDEAALAALLRQAL